MSMYNLLILTLVLHHITALVKYIIWVVLCARKKNYKNLYNLWYQNYSIKLLHTPVYCFRERIIKLHITNILWKFVEWYVQGQWSIISLKHFQFMYVRNDMYVLINAYDYYDLMNIDVVKTETFVRVIKLCLFSYFGVKLYPK